MSQTWVCSTKTERSQCGDRKPIVLATVALLLPLRSNVLLTRSSMSSAHTKTSYSLVCVSIRLMTRSECAGVVGNELTIATFVLLAHWYTILVARYTQKADEYEQRLRIPPLLLFIILETRPVALSRENYHQARLLCNARHFVVFSSSSATSAAFHLIHGMCQIHLGPA
jgi:hypothetical protein